MLEADAGIGDEFGHIIYAAVNVEANGPLGATLTYDVTATDAVDGTVPVECTPSSPQTFFLGMPADVVCTATDSAGNTASSTRHVVVVDTTPPMLTLPASITVTAPSSGGAVVSFTATATDLVSPSVAVTCTPSSGFKFPVGVTTVGCGAVDGAGNHAQGTFTVTILPPPNTPPVVTVPANLTVEASGRQGAIVTFVASASDAQDGPLAPTCQPLSGSTFALGTTTVSCKATDSGGLTGSASFNVTVKDSKGPVFSNVPTSPIVAYATCAAGANVTYTPPKATDVVDGALAVVCTPASGSQFTVRKTTVTCSAADAHGNSDRASFTVWVKLHAPTNGTFYLQPINSDGSSIFKLGSTIPVKFKLTGASAGITNLVATLSVAKVSNQVTGTTVEAVSTAASNAGNTYRYDPTTQQYIFNLSTKGMTAGTWSLQTNLGDLVPHTVNVSLR